jgi:hypothetical protein
MLNVLAANPLACEHSRSVRGFQTAQRPFRSSSQSSRSCYNSWMPNLRTPEGATYILQALVSAFLAILFLQSGIDKVVDRRGNLEWLKGHFAKSPLAGMVPLMVTAITILEIAAGALSATGCALIVFSRDSTVAFYGVLVSAISIIALFFGQRMAKDYAGAAILVPYFLLALIAIYLLAR